jgi:hypothetical protein
MMSKPNHRSWVLTSLGAAGIAGLVFACSSSGDRSDINVPPGTTPTTMTDGGTTTGDNTLPAPIANDSGAQATYTFQPVGPAVYVPKIKNLMLGLPATDDEIAQVTKDPSTFRTLVTGWIEQPQFQQKMIGFFRNAFQQNNVSLNQLETNTNFPLDNWLNNNYQARFVRSLEDHFALTAWDAVKSGAPFNGTMNTTTYEMTTAQLVFLTYLDELQVADTGQTTNRLTQRHAIQKFTINPGSTASLTDVLNPSSPSYMAWPDPVAIPMGCTSTPPLTFDSTSDAGYNNEGQNYQTLFTLIFGGTVTYLPCYPADQNGNSNTPQATPLLQASDFTDYRPVTFTHIAKTDTTSPAFYEIPSLRAASTTNPVGLHVTREGFTGTLAFETNWGTNVTNESRVTTNQSLIVSIAQSIDGENTVSLFPPNTTDLDHASNPACTGCHSQLDPIKQFYNHTLTLYYSDQEDQTSLATQAAFGIDGVSAQGTFTPDLFNILATHPRFPLAWAGKLVFWSTSVQAEESDMELVRIAQAFQSSNYNFKTLALETFTSPLVTFAAATQTTTDNGVLNTVARADHWCAALSNRLGVPDICGQVTTSPTNTQQTIASRATLLPTDEYFRGYAYATLATNPDLIFRDTVEIICQAVAGEVIDDNTDAGPSRYSSTNPTAAITDMVNNVMGLAPSDPRTATATTTLTNHLAAAEALGAAKADALKSVFTLACTSPSSVLMGL